MIRAGVIYRIFRDQVGSPILIVDTTSGQILEQITYDSFGNIINDTKPGFQPFGFAGGLYDPDTNFLRFGARDYDPSIGRWTLKDPILFSGGDTNLYGYVQNDPVNTIDSAGVGFGGVGGCTYNSESGNIVCYNSDTNEILTGEGYAGSGEGLNNPAFQSITNVGPLPEGIYITGTATNTLNGRPHDTVIPLNPLKSNEMYNRNLFRMHNGDFVVRNSSTGCIVMPDKVRKILAKEPGTVVQVVTNPPEGFEMLWLYLDELAKALGGLQQKH